MHRIVLLTLAVVVILPAAESLKCHFCESTSTDLHCFQSRTRKDCYEAYTCAKTLHKIKGVPQYFRGCIARSYCNDPDSFCRSEPDRTNCEVYCCEGDYCNAGSRKVVSLFLVAGLTLVALLV